MLAAGTGVGFAVGRHHHTQPHAAIGTAYSSKYEITVRTSDWAYGVPLDTPWTDSAGGEHVGRRPSCLPPGTVPRVHFQWVSYAVHGVGQRVVVEVDC
jgi:hypothetical protein